MQRLLTVEVANYKVVALFACIALLCCGVAAVSRRRVIVLGVVAVVAITMTAADAVNTYFGYLPQVADVVGAVTWQWVPARSVLAAAPTAVTVVPAVARRDGGVLALPVRGAHSGFGRHRVLVDLPPQYFADPTRRFPVVYLLHGSPGRPEDWLRAAKLPELARRVFLADTPVIFVMPPMSRGWLDDSECVDGRRERIETWLVNDVVPQVDQRLRTLADRGHRAVAGMSAGGFCALNLAVRHSDLFAVALDMSGYAEPTYAGGLQHLFGPTWQAAAAANSPAQYVAHHQVTTPLRVRFDVGRGDGRPMRDARFLLAVLARAGIDATLTTRPGGHTYHVWVPALRSGIGWFTSVWYPEFRSPGWSRRPPTP